MRACVIACLSVRACVRACVRAAGGNGIVGAQVPLGAGMALAAKYKTNGGLARGSAGRPGPQHTHTHTNTGRPGLYTHTLTGPARSTHTK